MEKKKTVVPNPFQTMEMGLRKKLCKQYLTKLDKAKITGISLI